MSGRDNIESRLYERLGDIQAKVGRIDERSEANAARLTAVNECLDVQNERLSDVEKAISDGQAVRRFVTWVAGITATVIAALKVWAGKGS